MAKLITTLGPIGADSLGMILPHEHVFVELGPIEAASYLSAEAGAVIALMAPEIEKIKRLNITALVECTPVGVGRRANRHLPGALDSTLGAGGQYGRNTRLDARRTDWSNRGRRRAGRLDQAQCCR